MSKWNGINQLDSVQLVQGAIDTELKAHSAISIQQARRASLWLNNKAVLSVISVLYGKTRLHW